MLVEFAELRVTASSLAVPELINPKLYVSSSNFDFSEAKYDLELVQGSTVVRLLEGKVKLSKNITV